MSKLTVLAALSVSLMVSLCCAQPGQEEGQKMSFEHGFRYDPMNWVENDTTLQGALVRRDVLKQPKAGDEQIIQGEIAKALAEQKPDGSFGATSDDTGGQLHRLLDMGIERDRPEVATAVEAILRQKPADDEAVKDGEELQPLGLSTFSALCMLGRFGEGVVKDSLQKYAQREEFLNSMWYGCPWAHEIHWKRLWVAREHCDLEMLVNASISAAARGINAAGTDPFKSSWGYIDAVGQIDSPEAKALLVKLVPLILRGQKPDGGWGYREEGVHDTSPGNTVSVLRALVRHGLLQPLRARPALPPDWTIARTIPAPEGEIGEMAWDGRQLWVHRKDTSQALAISPADGELAAEVQLPEGEVAGFFCWDGSLAILQSDPKRLLKVHPTTGAIEMEVSLEQFHWTHRGVQVAGKVWVYDPWYPWLAGFHPDQPDDLEKTVLPGRAPMALAPQGDTLWFSDGFAGLLLRSNLKGELLDFGECPFEEPVVGIAFDGANLWALDAENKRICVIERAR